MFKLVNGIEVAMTSDEQTALAISQTVNLTELKTSLIEDVNRRIAKIYDKWQRFSYEYAEREAAARAYKALGYTGAIDDWIGAYSGNAGISSTEATDNIIAQADILRSVLRTLGNLRMDKYQILNAETELDVRQTHSDIVETIDEIAALT